ncbi:MAG: hypothetical protein HPY57_15270 [Ignavibacteria bacterium]|nr:hypothetical protein [Ignavibacteria bacterium]
MKKIISFCLWGNNPKYTIGAIKNAHLTNKIYPGWISRFYCSSKSTPNDIIKELKNINNVEIVMTLNDGWVCMFDRFLPASENDVEVMISRDTDSRLNLREKYAVDEWLKSNKSFHIMRDHPYHGTEILGGMWGVRGKILSDMKELIEKYIKGNFWQVDQNFLKEHIYQKIKDDCFVHDEFFNYEKHKKPFPTKRIGQEFVGEAFDEYDQPFNIKHRMMIKN